MSSATPSLRVLHLVGSATSDFFTGLTLLAGEVSCTWHPLFRRHPVSGRTVLVLSTPVLSTPERCQKLSNISNDKQAIAALYKRFTRWHQVYRHAWQPDDVVVWDNRCTMHRADHSQVVGDRTLHRGLVAGEAPIPAFQT
ncbi:MAG: TauD/TfdA family dioxygenase [Phormidesmis sp.]